MITLWNTFHSFAFKTISLSNLRYLRTDSKKAKGKKDYFFMLEKSANIFFNNISSSTNTSLWFGTYCLRITVGGSTEAFIVGSNISSLFFGQHNTAQSYWPAQWQWGWHAHDWWTDHWTAEFHNSYGRPHTPYPGAERYIPLQKKKGMKWSYPDNNYWKNGEFLLLYDKIFVCK